MVEISTETLNIIAVLLLLGVIVFIFFNKLIKRPKVYREEYVPPLTILPKQKVRPVERLVEKPVEQEERQQPVSFLDKLNPRTRFAKSLPDTQVIFFDTDKTFWRHTFP